MLSMLFQTTAVGALGGGAAWGLLHDGALGGTAAILDDGHSRLGDGRLVRRHLQDLSLGFGRALEEVGVGEGGEVGERKEGRWSREAEGTLSESYQEEIIVTWGKMRLLLTLHGF